MRHIVRLHLCTVYVCTAQDVVQCVSQATSTVSSCVSFVAGALRGIHAEALLPPDPKGWISAVAAPATWTTLLSARAERVPDCSSYLSRIPGSATDSGSSIHPRDFPWIAQRSALLSSRTGRLHALLNASAASESTAAGSLKACLIKRQRC